MRKAQRITASVAIAPNATKALVPHISRLIVPSRTCNLPFKGCSFIPVSERFERRPLALSDLSETKKRVGPSRLEPEASGVPRIHRVKRLSVYCPTPRRCVGGGSQRSCRSPRLGAAAACQPADPGRDVRTFLREGRRQNVRVPVRRSRDCD